MDRNLSTNPASAMADSDAPSIQCDIPAHSISAQQYWAIGRIVFYVLHPKFPSGKVGRIVSLLIVVLLFLITAGLLQRLQTGLQIAAWNKITNKEYFYFNYDGTLLFLLFVFIAGHLLSVFLGRLQTFRFRQTVFRSNHFVNKGFRLTLSVRNITLRVQSSNSYSSIAWNDVRKFVFIEDLFVFILHDESFIWLPPDTEEATLAFIREQITCSRGDKK